MITSALMRRAERTGRAMGSDALVVVWSAHAARLADLAMQRIAILEDCWSRFRPASELNRLHARAGQGPIPVSEDLLRLVAVMCSASAWTQGTVDASVLGAMHAIGYDVDFSSTLDCWPAESSPGARSALVPGLRGVRIDAEARTVELPTGLGLDPGGIGKGLAGDLVADELAEAGAHAVLISLGGDVVVRGRPPSGPGWVVAVHDDRYRPAGRRGTLVLDEPSCAVATSSVLRRRWRHGHHIIDPRTGLASQADVVQATVMAGRGWQAEAAATLAIVRGSAEAMAWLGEQGLSAMLLPADLNAPAWTCGRLSAQTAMNELRDE